MKKMSVSLVMMSLVVSSGFAMAQTKTEVLKPEAVYTPKSFDSNDNAQVVVAGAFHGYCMKMGTTQHSVDYDLNRIYIKQYVSVNGNCNDLEMYIPYSSVINLGTLRPGNYEVVVATSETKFAKISTLPIHEAKSTGNGTDDRVYAPVSSVDFKTDGNFSNPSLVLKGVFTNTCLSLDKVEVYARPGNVIEVLPIVKKEAQNCASTMKAFTKVVELKGLGSSNTLIHVRSMNGQALNKVITHLDRIFH